MICATLSLAACSYFDVGDEVDVSSATPETVDLTAQREEIESLDLMDTMSRSAHPSVEVYSLDGSPASSKFANRPAPSRSGGVFSSDPSVQVFPLDDAMRNMMSPALMPPSEAPPVYPPAAPPAPMAPVESAPLNTSSAAPLLPEPDAPVRGSEGLLARIFFGHDSDEIDGEGQSAIATATSARGGGGLSVEGHASVQANYADEIQRKIVNLRVSMNRALTVARALIAGGVPAESIRTVAWGDTRPPDEIPGKDAESAARRVEIYSASLQ